MHADQHPPYPLYPSPSPPLPGNSAAAKKSRDRGGKGGEEWLFCFRTVQGQAARRAGGPGLALAGRGSFPFVPVDAVGKRGEREVQQSASSRHQPGPMGPRGPRGPRGLSYSWEQLSGSYPPMQSLLTDSW